MNERRTTDAVCELSQRFYFEAAHTLQRTVEKESSRRIHGHSYEAEVTLQGQADPATGMLVDLAQIDDRIIRHYVGDGAIAAIRERFPQGDSARSG